MHTNTCTTHPEPMLLLRGRLYGNNSIVNLNEIGQNNEALFCITNNTNCCNSTIITERLGNWYLPSSTIINRYSIDFYGNRGPSTVSLNRRNDSTILSGIFHCEIPDTSGANQILYIGVYLDQPGEGVVVHLRVL